LNCNQIRKILSVQADLIIYALVAAGLVFWLKNILGTRHGDERERPNPFTQAPAEKPAIQPAAAIPSDALMIDDGLVKPDLPRNVSFANDAAEQQVFEIARAERDFDLLNFAQAVQDAFVIIVEAFAQGDRATLKNLLSDKVYAAFDGALNEREASGEKVETEIHSVRKMEFVGARIDGSMAHITLRFIADETCVVRNEAGDILSGDPDRITEMNDIWTFSHELKSRDPRWLLSETSDGNVVEDHKTPLPDVIA
jgi:predicted lipid-binding transport protein (Tim44 family)